MAVTPAMYQEMVRLREEGKKIVEIARELGVSWPTVSSYLKRGRYPWRVKSVEVEDVPQERKAMHGYELPKRDKPHYEVLIFNFTDRPKFEATKQFMYYPNLNDMLAFCHEAGIQRVNDFEDHGDCFKEKYVYGSIYSSGRVAIGEYLISRMVDEPVHPQELLR